MFHYLKKIRHSDQAQVFVTFKKASKITTGMRRGNRIESYGGFYIKP